jgi:tRNA (mo5U34)-methyltransferase
MDLSKAEVLEKVRSVSHWYHQIRIGDDIVTPGINASALTLEHLELPDSCRGLRALDLGTRDGFFAFELERRGAEVIAVDYYPANKTGFGVASELLGSRVTFRQDNIYKLTRKEYGEFDIVLFLGLIYHLPDPMLALSIVRSLCRGLLYLETHVIDNALLMPDGRSVPLRSLAADLDDIPLMQFYPGTSLNGDPTNYWGPNVKCMEKMLRENDFAVLYTKLLGGRALFRCRAQGQDHAWYNDIARGVRTP